MRSNVVFAVLVVLLGVFVGALLVRKRVPSIAPAPAASASASSSSSASAAASAPASAPRPAGAVDPHAKPSLGRPLRVAALGWDLAAPGILSNNGLGSGDKKSRFWKRGLDMELSVVPSTKDVERALARGGKDKSGADVAVLPLPVFVASFEHLRALDPVMFLVTGWSSGREVLKSKPNALPAFPAKGDVDLGAVPGSSAALLGLFALDTAGVEPARVKLVSPGTAGLQLVAMDREAEEGDAGSGGLSLLFGTGDAARLVPFVAVAQRSLIEQHRTALVTWARVWLAAAKNVSDDASSAARRVASEKAAPEPLSLLTRLGEETRETLAGNAAALELSGRGAVTLESLFRRTWRIWRETEVLGTPVPERVPVTGDIVAALVRSAKPSELGSVAPKPAAEADAGTAAPAAKASAPLLVYRQPGKKPDVDALVPVAGFLAGVFPRSPIQITLYKGALTDKKATAAAVARVADRYGIAEERLSAGSLRYGPGSAAGVAVLPAR